MREEFIAILRDLVKRGPALGIILIVATQKPDAKSIPSSIADNASARLCLKVNGQVSNDQILGTSSYRDGIRATQFAFSDKGIAYFRGDGAEPLIVRTVNGIDAAMADELAARARALRQAAGLLTGEADDAMDAVVVLDVVADAARALDDRGRPTAHLAELVGWLQELRPDYADLDADELGKRLRNAGAVVRQVKVGGRTTSGVRATDLRKGDGEPGTELANLDEA
jgi:S-DNA-T family DNA segregation ATPase FtsK/SpoIIIE